MADANAVAAAVAPAPGWKTTEFWKAAVVTVVGLVLASGAIHVPEGGIAGQIIGGIMATVVPSIYSLSRAAVKNVAAQATAAAIGAVQGNE